MQSSQDNDLEKTLREISETQVLEKSGGIIDDFNKLSANEIIKKIQSNDQWPIGILCSDVNVYARFIFDAHLKVFQRLSKFSGEIQAALILRVVKAALILKKAGEITLILDTITGKSPTVALCGYLYLSAQTGSPVDPENFEVGRCDRLAALTLYYHAVNLIFLGNYEKAHTQLMRAMTLKGCPSDITSELALVCFLRGYSLHFVKISLNDHFRLPDHAEKLFQSVDMPQVDMFPPTYVAIWPIVIAEFQKRKVVNFSKFVEKVKRTDLEKIAGGKEQLERLIASKVIQIAENDGIVTFLPSQNRSDFLGQEIRQLLELQEKLNEKMSAQSPQLPPTNPAPPQIPRRGQSSWL